MSFVRLSDVFLHLQGCLQTVHTENPLPALRQKQPICQKNKKQEHVIHSFS